MRRRMYRELGGYAGYLQTPVRELQEIRLSILAELTVQAEQREAMEQKQKERIREMERQQQKPRGGR